jgi:hypothetical protein
MLHNTKLEIRKRKYQSLGADQHPTQYTNWPKALSGEQHHEHQATSLSWAGKNWNSAGLPTYSNYWWAFHQIQHLAILIHQTNIRQFVLPNLRSLSPSPFFCIAQMAAWQVRERGQRGAAAMPRRTHSSLGGCATTEIHLTCAQWRMLSCLKA